MRRDIYRKLNRKELRRYTSVKLEEMNQNVVDEQRKNEKIMFGIVLSLLNITIIFIMKGWLWTEVDIFYIIWLTGFIIFFPMPFLTARLHNSSKKIIKELNRRHNK